MPYAQINYEEKLGTGPLAVTIHAAGCFLDAFCNLAERFGAPVDPPTLDNYFNQHSDFIRESDGTVDLLSWGSITAYNPNWRVTASGNGAPTSNDSIVKFIYNGGTTHFCLVLDAAAHTIIDSWDGKTKNWSVYGGPVAYASYTNDTPAPTTTAKPAPAASQGTYGVVVPVAGYMTATNAANHAAQADTVQPGTYEIFNQAQGMINVTTHAGVAGSWINPADNGTPAPAAPAAASHPYTVEAITPKQMVGDAVRTEWNLDDTTWPSFTTNPAGSLAAGQPITVVAIAHHTLGSSYYMEDANVAKGYNIVDLHDYTAPAPAPAPDPTPAPAAPAAPAAPQIIYEKLPAPVTYKAKLQPTDVWGFNHDTWPAISADVKRQLNQGDNFTAAGRAKHELGGVYMMTAAAFGDADTSGTPALYEGINVVDLDGNPEAQAPAAAAVVPEVAPAPAEAPAAPEVPAAGVVITPTITSTANSPTSTTSTVKVGSAADWRKSFKESVGPLVSTAEIWVHDLEGVLPDIKLEAGKLIPKAGNLWKDGKKYVLTIPSHAKGNFYGIPSEVTGPVARSQMRQAEQIVENIWDKYYKTIEDELDELFHDGLKFEEDTEKGFGTLKDDGKLSGLDKLADSSARFLFGRNKKQK